jgi:hypothetical protein
MDRSVRKILTLALSLVAAIGLFGCGDSSAPAPAAAVGIKANGHATQMTGLNPNYHHSPAEDDARVGGGMNKK